MTISQREQLKADIRRKRIKQLLKQGMSISKAAKTVGCSYAHAKQIAEQEQRNT